ncbi:Conserved_hypothetical protein [Hexamita inflata]|uniref:Uncharacterized protein n=1 Tax=Hexamita inflata TaxID=28002 RepID=A0AA86NXZ9_9EUKA|nr:Conserved hypothetical protein [Hexamita inflata]
MNPHMFTDALYQYLLSINISLAKEAAKIQQQIDSMDKGAKRGIWNHVGSILNVSCKAAHNYYHNTWSAQFFDSLTSYRTFIKRMVLDNPHMSNQDLIKQFLNKFPEKNFSRHNLQQIVYIQKQRLGFSQNSDNASSVDSEVTSVNQCYGFSVDISECVRFLDAVSM